MLPTMEAAAMIRGGSPKLTLALPFLSVMTRLLSQTMASFFYIVFLKRRKIFVTIQA